MSAADQKEIFKKLAEIDFQVGRLLSDAQSEKDTRKRRNDGFDMHLEKVRDDISFIKEWISKVEGIMLVLKVIIGILSAVIIALIIAVITK